MRCAFRLTGRPVKCSYFLGFPRSFWMCTLERFGHAVNIEILHGLPHWTSAARAQRRSLSPPS
jgi:hypothetical protein